MHEVFMNSASRFGGWTTVVELPNRERKSGVKASEHAYAYLKELIVMLELPPRAIITESEVASALGISRTPAREAFFRLEAERLIELLPRRGAMVPDITLRSIREQAETRSVMEGYGVEWICDRRLPLGDTLYRLIAQQREIFESHPDRIFDQVIVDKEFHWSLVKATGNTEFARLYDSLHDRQVRTGVAMFKSVPGRPACAIEQHTAIADAVAAFDKTEALRLLRFHLIDSISDVSHVFTE